jgi:hypothetical protein
MKKLQLQDLIKEAIQEILGEDLKQDARQKKLVAIDAEIKALQKDKVNVTTGTDSIGEARGPIRFKLADDYESKVAELPYNNSEKRMKWVNGIVDYVEENGAKDITTIAREKFNVPQPRIADYARDMIRLGILVPENEGTVPQFMRPEDEDGEEEPGGVEDMFVGNKENPLSMYFDDEAPSPEEEPEIPAPAQSSNVNTPNMSDEEFKAWMRYQELERRVAGAKSNILKAKKSTSTPGDIRDKPSNEVENLRKLKKKMEDEMATIASKFPSVVKNNKDSKNEASKAEPLDEWTINRMQYYAGIKK